eukprot:CAMPEP_0184319822 /NCGR_PEP_ID=MMETSP1049-20130417/110779_1 /TAXON_ID=77928 /ORGANISM="Proteomonas sulcata, Strain CCMP704" /LENGTH=57 /DNA_ID=CAMNT_0026640129 /DNA_START=82 /DNA_END=255 /DNA_ORIENTATION=+
MSPKAMSTTPQHAARYIFIFPVVRAGDSPSSCLGAEARCSGLDPSKCILGRARGAED